MSQVTELSPTENSEFHSKQKLGNIFLSPFMGRKVSLIFLGGRRGSFCGRCGVEMGMGGDKWILIIKSCPAE